MCGKKRSIISIYSKISKILKSTPEKPRIKATNIIIRYIPKITTKPITTAFKIQPVLLMSLSTSNNFFIFSSLIKFTLY